MEYEEIEILDNALSQVRDVIWPHIAQATEEYSEVVYLVRELEDDIAHLRVCRRPEIVAVREELEKQLLQAQARVSCLKDVLGKLGEGYMYLDHNHSVRTINPWEEGVTGAYRQKRYSDLLKNGSNTAGACLERRLLSLAYGSDAKKL